MTPTTTRRSRVSRTLVRPPIPKHKLIELKPEQNKVCMFCGRKEISEMLYGKLYQLNDIVIHYFCVLLSKEGAQKGADEDGLFGFLYEDIKAELTRGAKEPCFYCHKRHATISCSEPQCTKTFHLPCGLENGCLNQYFHNFKSYCVDHRVNQTVNKKYLENSTPTQCSICREDIVANPSPSSIWASCCNHWFHRNCIQNLALSSGYFFKCPLCNNDKKFKKNMLVLGIYIPSRDASWESDPNAFAELLERHNSCDIDHCYCPYPEKRNYSLEDGPWSIVLCYTCGSNGTHKLCSSVKCDEKWMCETCTNTPDSSNANRRQDEISNGDSNTLQDESSALNNSIVSTITREVSPSDGTREYVEPNNEETQNEPPTIDDTVMISDGSDFDSN